MARRKTGSNFRGSCSKLCIDTPRRRDERRDLAVIFLARRAFDPGGDIGPRRAGAGERLRHIVRVEAARQQPGLSSLDPVEQAPVEAASVASRPPGGFRGLGVEQQIIGDGVEKRNGREIGGLAYRNAPS